MWKHFNEVAAAGQHRGAHIREELEPLLQRAEAGPSPVAVVARRVLARLDSESVTAEWDKALTRCDGDPEGAITAARSLLESVCKTVLDDARVKHQDSAKLGELYRAVRDLLRLAPEEQTNGALTRMFGGAQSIAGALGELRNKAGDAHGKGRYPFRLDARHARLAVNATGDPGGLHRGDLDSAGWQTHTSRITRTPLTLGRGLPLRPGT